MKILNLLKNLFLVTPLCAVASVSAETYYFDLSAYKNFSGTLSLSESLTHFTEGKSDFWYTQDTSGNKTYISSAFSLTDTSNSYVIGPKDGNLSTDKPIYVDSDFYGDTFTSGLSSTPILAQGSNPITLKFKTIKSNTYNGGFAGKNLNIEIVNIEKGKWNDGWQFGSASTSNGWAPLASLKITGTWNLSGSGGGIWSSIYVLGVPNHSIDNPDVIINTLTGAGSTGPSFSNLAFGSGDANNKTSLFNETSYVDVKTTTSGAGFIVSGSTASTGQMNVVFTNNANATTSGWLFEGYYQRYVAAKDPAPEIPESWSLKNGGAKLALIMRSSTSNGDGTYTYHNSTQAFTGNVITFTGGVEMISGKLLINYSPTTIGADVSHGTLKLAQANGASTSFGNANATVGGNFIFDNIEVSGGGTLIVRLNKNGGSIAAYDQISLSTGGISYASGATGTLTIDFGTNTADYLADLIRTDASEGLKIIAFSEGQTSSVNFGAVLSSFEKDGVEYMFKTFNGTDGVYAAYVAVPEPATVAAILGGLVLALAAYRRRK